MRKRNPNILPKIFLMVLIVSLCIWIFFLNGFGIFTVKTVEVENSKLGCVDNSQIKNTANILGQNFFFVNKEDTKILLDKFICVKNITLTKVFPNKVKIQVTGRQPSASLSVIGPREATDSSIIVQIATPSALIAKDSFLVDDEGVVFDKNDNSLNIPKIYTVLDVSLGKKIQDSLIGNSLKILDGAKTLGLETRESFLTDNFLVIFSQPRIIFKILDNIDIKLASLQLILSEAKIENEELQFIDLRFDKPVIRLAPKKDGKR